MEKKNPNEVRITTYDKLMRSWENSMQLTKDFEIYAKEIEDDKKAAQIFNTFAQEEGMHASKFRDMLLQYQNHQ